MPKNDGAGLRIVVILIITFLCLGISFYQMTIGYKEFGGYFISGILSFVVVLILFYLNFEIHKARKENKSILIFMAGYLFFVLISFAGNFNAFYTFFMKDELLKTELSSKYSNMNKMRADAEVAIKAKKGVSDKVSTLLSDLDSQIRSRDEPGCGPKCNEILQKIESALNRKITRIRSRDNDYLANEYRRIIIGGEETDLLASIDQDISKLKPDIENATKYPNAYGLETIKAVVDKGNNYIIRVKKLTGDEFKYESNLNVDNAEMGRISQTFLSASHHIDHWGTWISGFMALMIDLFVPLFIIAFTTGGEKPSFSWGGRGAENLS